MESTMTQVHVEFDVPALIASQAGLDLKNISQNIRQILALFLYEHRRISIGKACELGGISQWDFADLNRQLGIPIQYLPDDLADDMQRLTHV